MGRLGRGHHDRPGAQRNGVGAVEMVEVGVADEDEVSLVHLGRAEPDRRQAGQAIEVGVEEQVEPGMAHAEGGGAEPLECRRHGVPPVDGAATSPWGPTSLAENLTALTALVAPVCSVTPMTIRMMPSQNT